MYRIAFAAHVGFEETDIVERANNSVAFRTGNHQFFSVDINRIVFDKVDRHGSFGHEHRVFEFVQFGVMPFDDAFIDGVGNFYVSCSGGKFPISVIIQTIAFNQAVVVFDVGLPKEMCQVSLGIVKPFFGINKIGLAGNGRWSKKVGMTRVAVIIQMIGLDYRFGIRDGNRREELEFFFGNIIFSGLAFQDIIPVGNRSVRIVIDFLGVAVKVDGVGDQGGFRGVHNGISRGKSLFHVAVVFGIFTVEIQGVALHQLHVSKGFDVIFLLEIVGFVASHDYAVVVNADISGQQGGIGSFELVYVKIIRMFHQYFFGYLRQKVLRE